MSTDPSAPEFTLATTEKSSSNRVLDSEYRKSEAHLEESVYRDSNVGDEIGVGNPPKRIKVVAIGGEASVDIEHTSDLVSTNVEAADREAFVDENLLKSFDARDTVISGLTSPEPSKCINEKDKGKYRASIGSIRLPAATTRSAIDTGVEIAASQERETFEPLSVPSPAVTRSRSTDTDKELDISWKTKSENSAPRVKPKARWRVHQMAEDYTSLVGSMMYPATEFQPYGYSPEERQYPLEKISLLGFVKSPLRRPTIIEKWSPYEIALFEGSMLHYGKEFQNISRQIRTKTTQEVIDFYYIWKKTAHYKKWKEQYVSDEDLIDDYQIPLKKPKR